MSKLSPDQWRALSPHLDQALEMTDDQRTIWLSSLQNEKKDRSELKKEGRKEKIKD